MTSEIGRRIKAIRQNLDINQTDFAKQLGYDKNTVVSAWESEKSIPPTDVLIKIAKLGSCTLDWLITGIDSVHNPPPFDPDKVPSSLVSVNRKPVPVVGIFNGGDPRLIYREDNILETLYIEIDSNTNLFALKVDGDSMVHPTNKAKSIEPGDYVIINTTIPPITGDVVAVSLRNGRQVIKVLFVDKTGDIELHSYNPDHQPMYPQKEDIEIMYKVCKIQPKIKNP